MADESAKIVKKLKVIIAHNFINNQKYSANT